jgi:hypothetical protein
MTTHITDDRQAALRVGYEATDWHVPMEEATFRMCMEGWQVQALVRDNETIGAVFRRGDELHLSILPGWRCRWATKGLLRQLFGNTTTRTRVTPGHEYYMHDILRRLGFVQLDSGEFVKGH